MHRTFAVVEGVVGYEPSESSGLDFKRKQSVIRAAMEHGFFHLFTLRRNLQCAHSLTFRLIIKHCHQNIKVMFNTQKGIRYSGKCIISLG